MAYLKPRPVDSFDRLRNRIDQLFKDPNRNLQRSKNLSLEPSLLDHADPVESPTFGMSEFLHFISDSLPNGDIYLFGGLVRDIALFGCKGFNSDVDLVVDGEWTQCVSYLESLGAKKNKFGGFRLDVAGWPIDIWNAKETWAIKQGLVQYQDISSLLETTVLNWDAILMNYRTKNFICRENYLYELNERILDIILIENPNPLGMAVRVFRHFSLKDAKKISHRAAEYMTSCALKYSLEDLTTSEFISYGTSLIEPTVYSFFYELSNQTDADYKKRFFSAAEKVRKSMASHPMTSPDTKKLEPAN